MKFSEISWSDISVKPEDVTQGKVVDKNYRGQDRRVWEGTKYYDIYIDAMGETLRAMFDNNRLFGTEYAQIYSQLIPKAMELAIQTCMQNKQMAINLSQEQALSPLKQEQLRAQTRLYERQERGFDDNLYIKLLEAQLSAFSMIYSSGMLDDPVMPDPLNKQELRDIYSTFKTRAKEVKEYVVENRIVKPESKIEL